MQTPTQTLQEKFVATRLSFSWWNLTRQVNQDTRQRMAEAVDAEQKSINGNAKIYNTKLEAIKKINALKNEIHEYWENLTRPWPEGGIRLLLKEQVSSFNEKMNEYQFKLANCATDVENQRFAIIQDARDRLGSAFDPRNYPSDLTTLYKIEWSFPSLKPVGDLPPEVLQQQQKLFEQKFQEAARLFEETALQELHQLTEFLCDKLSPDPSGQKKVFHQTAISNITDFLERFKTLNVGSSKELEQAVSQCQEALHGITARDLRGSDPLKNEIRGELEKVKASLSPLVLSTPRRKIVKAIQPTLGVAS